MPSREGIYEYEDKKSTFIAYSRSANTEKKAFKFIENIKYKNPGAKHYVYAMVTKYNSFNYKYSDDKEPPGTSGTQLLNILKTNNFGNSLLVVVRFFGGTLLGTGRLARAYSKAGKNSLLKSKPLLMVSHRIYRCKTDYKGFERIRNYAKEGNFILSNEEYKENVVFNIAVKPDCAQLVLLKLKDITSGRIENRYVKSDYLPDTRIGFSFLS